TGLRGRMTGGNMKITFACIVLMVSLPGFVGVAHAAPAQGTFYLRGTAGYATQALGDINRDIEMRASHLRYVLTPRGWHKMGGAVRLEEAGGYQISPHFSVGIGMGYQKSSATQSGTYAFSDDTGVVW